MPAQDAKSHFIPQRPLAVYFWTARTSTFLPSGRFFDREGSNRVLNPTTVRGLVRGLEKINFLIRKKIISFIGHLLYKTNNINNNINKVMGLWGL
jgi:hypothetical protein